MGKIREEFLEKPVIIWLKKHPVIKKFVVFVILMQIIIIPSVIFYTKGWKPKLVIESNQYGLFFIKNPLGENTESQKIADAMAPKKQSKPQFDTECPLGWICSDFEKEDFSGWDEYAINQLNTRSIQVSVDSVFDNPPLFFRNSETKIDFTVILKVTPRNQEKGNVVILWNETWRCIIAESDYNKITCEGNYPNTNKVKRKQQFLSKLGKNPISPDKEIKIEIKSNLISSENKNKITMNLDYIDTSGNSESADFEWVFDLNTADIENYKQLIGVGVIDPNNEKIEAEFKKLEILPSL